MSTSNTTIDSPSALSATPSRARLPALDVLRGLAILGTLLTNIWIFSSPVVSDLSDLGTVGGEVRTTVDEVVQTGLQFVTDGKWIGLLTIMFGIGLEIQRQSAVRKGAGWPGTYPWRGALLVVEGTLNYLFVFEFDVLMGYGLTALVVAVILARSPRVQAIWLVIGVSVHLAFLAFLSGWIPLPGGGADLPVDDARFDAMYADIEAAREAGRTLTEDQLEAIAQRHGVDPEVFGPVGDMGPATPVGTQSYWSMVQQRAENFVSGRAEIPIMLTMGLGLFLVGALLYRRGLFLPSGRRLRRVVMALGFGIGIPLDIAGRTVWEADAGMVTRYGTSTIVAFGVLALVAAIYASRDRTGPLGTALSWVGKMAMTCYIMQNVLCSLIFYDFGLGLAAKIPPQWTTFATLAVYVGVSLMLVFGSGLWLRFFSRGPFELLMHRVHEGLVARVHEPVAARRAARRAARHTRRA